MRLVYLSPVPWASFAQRPQKFVRWFHEKTAGEVLWLDPYPSRFPCLEDFKKIGVSDKTDSDKYESWLTVLKPKALPIEPLPASGLINGPLYWAPLLKTVKTFAADQKILLVIGKPTVLALQVLKLLEGHTSVYDAMDDFPTFFTGLSQTAMARRELSIGQKTSFLLASSTKLKEKWGQYRKDVMFVPNGLDLTSMPPANKQPSDGPEKIFGYVGTVGAWFNWEWVIRLAECRPNDEIHIVGPIYNPSKSPLPKNIKLFAPCSHKVALLTMQSFDVALIPFLKSALTMSVDPIKYYEYRALNLPMISTSFGEMAYRGEQDGVYLCDEHADIEKVAANALHYNAINHTAEQFKSENSWEARFNNLNFI